MENSLSTLDAVLNLEAEVRLDPAISVQEGLSRANKAEHVFLTGTTGFIGAFLLYELLVQTSSTVYCLVRASTQEEGETRLKKHLESLLLWDESYRSRIVPIPGNLAQPLLGLSTQRFAELAETLDVIYHSGAQVNFLYPYHLLKATNVLGTVEVLRLACHKKVKPVHYISSTSVFDMDTYPEREIIAEQQIPTYNRLSSAGGYPQSKLVAEKLVMLGQTRGLPVAIYRVGNTSGHSKTGACNADDIIYRGLKTVSSQ
jgi:thioester reductase-like protein